MSEEPIETFIKFKDMRDILRDLEEQRVTEISTKIDELIKAGKEAQVTQKLDGMAMHDKKDGGKDCGKDVKDGKEGCDGKEACDPEILEFTSIYGDPNNLDVNKLNAIIAMKSVRLDHLLGSKKPII
jgi:hypothetical protein